MARVLSGPIHVAYSQAYVVIGETLPPTPRDAFSGQTNGLCGAAVKGALFLVTGLHTGQVGFTVDVLDAAPQIDKDWEEVVEASFTVPSEDEELEQDDIEIIYRDVSLVEWSGNRRYPLPISPGNYRVRYCALGMDPGRRRDTLLSGEDLIDFYSLAFWPAEPEPDRIIRQTSEIAASWHKAFPSYEGGKE
ncbi:MAG: hypothetical protein J2P21_21310 [Chloracidobacterium sp.]|nr:hypothetical protein [Chloracidobacterium sp.]